MAAANSVVRRLSRRRVQVQRKKWRGRDNTDQRRMYIVDGKIPRREIVVTRRDVIELVICQTLSRHRAQEIDGHQNQQTGAHDLRKIPGPSERGENRSDVRFLHSLRRMALSAFD